MIKFLMKKLSNKGRACLRYIDDHFFLPVRIRVVLREKLRTSQDLKIIIGAGRIPQEGWVSTEKSFLNILVRRDWEKLFTEGSIKNIFAEHVWEHLTDRDTELANKNCFDFLKEGGVLRIAVPDGLHTDKEYVNYVKPGGHGRGSDDHKILYTYTTMKERLEKAGFQVNLLEYWDEEGVFHYSDWTNDAGKIIRSKRYDERNQNGKLAYTSLIVDAVKP